MDAWVNRIIGHGMKPAGQFLAHPGNWRLHPQFQQAALSTSLTAIGWIDEVTENVQTGHVVDGHLRVTLALRHGEETLVPVRYVDLSPVEETLALVTKDSVAAMAITDPLPLEALIDEVTALSQEVDTLLAEVVAQEGLFPPQRPAPRRQLKVPCHLGGVTFTLDPALIEYWMTLLRQRFPFLPQALAAEYWVRNALSRPSPMEPSHAD